jgi:hypothetical protein
MTDTDGKPPVVRDTKDLLQAVAPVLAVGAVVVYGVLTVAYSKFYRELGVNPGDVGLDYGRGLQGVAGASIVMALAAVVFGLLWRVAARGREPTKRAVRWSVSILTLVSICVFAWALSQRADQHADNVKEGRWLQPLEIFDLEVLGVRAYPAIVKPATSAVVASGIAAETTGHRLFYIGQASGTMVLYDSTVQRVWHVPAALVSLTTENCETSYNITPVCRDTSNEQP